MVETREYEVGVAAGKRFIAHAVERQPPHTEPGVAGQHGPIIGEARPLVAGKVRECHVWQKRREPPGRGDLELAGFGRR